MADEVAPQEKEVVHPALTRFTIGDRLLELREMKIKRTKQLSELLFTLRSSLQGFFVDKEGNPLPDRTELPPEFEKSVNEAIVEILNFIFNTGKDITLDWYEENISLRILEEIIKEAARQSRVDWLPPFFEPFSQVVRGSIFLRATGEKRMDSASGNAITL